MTWAIVTYETICPFDATRMSGEGVISNDPLAAARAWALIGEISPTTSRNNFSYGHCAESCWEIRPNDANE